MGPFGRGLSAAMELRERILRALGAEKEWLERRDDGSVVWLTGLLATFFEVSPGFADTPDLGVLTIYTPVAIAGDIEAAFHDCDQLNRQAMVSRWLFVRTGCANDEVALAAMCSFVIGPRNVDALTAFAIWCVREQIVTAVGALDAGIADKAGDGIPYGWGPMLGREHRGKRHPVTMAAPYESGDPERNSNILAEHAYDAYNALVARMTDAGEAVWGTWADAEDLTFDVPVSWDDYPGGVIGRDGDGVPLTAIVKVACDDHPRAGGGLRFTMRTPWAPAPADAERNVSALNSGGSAGSASHLLGAWALREFPVEDEHGTVTHTVPVYRYTVFLPASLADSGYGIDLPAVLREVLLTLARMALIVRRTLNVREGLRDDGYQYIGLEAPYMRHGLAWGETGEGLNPGALALNALYDWLVREDTEQAVAEEDGFAWWPGDQMQGIALHCGERPHSITMSTEVRCNVPCSAEVLVAVARANFDLGLSALVAGPGDLRSVLLAARVPVYAVGQLHLPRLAQCVAADQFIAARDLRGRLDGVGEPAVTAHPFSGPGPRDEQQEAETRERFALRETALAPTAEQEREGLTSRVALLAVAGQGIPPLRISVREDGGLDYAWRLPSYERELAGTVGDPLICGEVFPGESPAGPGWIVRSRVPLAGDVEAKARWCNEQNAVLTSAGDGAAGLFVPGGWGLSPDGECCLTSRLPPISGVTEQGRVMYLRRVAGDHQEAVRLALRGTLPGSVISKPATRQELAEGLAQTVAAFRTILEYPADCTASVDTGTADVTLTIDGPLAGLPAFAKMTDDGSTRTVVAVPASASHTELTIAYAALLTRSTSRIEGNGEMDLAPGELPGWQLPDRGVSGAAGGLTKAGILTMPGAGTAVFPAGQGWGRAGLESLPSRSLHGAVPMIVFAEMDGLTQGDVDDHAVDGNVLGTWVPTLDNGGLRYGVIIPPTGLVWDSDYAVQELMIWLFRHVIRHVQAAAGPR